MIKCVCLNKVERVCTSKKQLISHEFINWNWSCSDRCTSCCWSANFPQSVHCVRSVAAAAGPLPPFDLFTVSRL